MRKKYRGLNVTIVDAFIEPEKVERAKDSDEYLAIHNVSTYPCWVSSNTDIDHPRGVGRLLKPGEEILLDDDTFWVQGISSDAPSTIKVWSEIK